MKILFFTPSAPDYLSDSLFHGLRTLLGDKVLDYPKYEFLYKSFDYPKSELYGRGFTLYGLLEDVSINRLNIHYRVKDRRFDLIIFPSIFEYFGFFLELLPYLNFYNTIVLDGADSARLYTFAGKWWRFPQWWFLPKAHTNFRYYKREWTPETIRNLWYQIPPSNLSRFLPAPKNLRTISFSIPSEKIITNLPLKTKLFPKHIVDPEVAKYVNESVTSYAFESETDYYYDLQSSKYGITTKRSGWDCLRHYEIAANGTVPCFKDLDKKPKTCAPHGLDQSNCIIYRNYDDLMNQISSINDQQYLELQKNSLNWVKQNTTLERAKQVLTDSFPDVPIQLLSQDLVD